MTASGRRESDHPVPAFAVRREHQRSVGGVNDGSRRRIHTRDALWKKRSLLRPSSPRPEARAERAAMHRAAHRSRSAVPCPGSAASVGPAAHIATPQQGESRCAVCRWIRSRGTDAIATLMTGWSTVAWTSPAGFGEQGR